MKKHKIKKDNQEIAKKDHKMVEIHGRDEFEKELNSDEGHLKVLKFYRDGCPHCANLGNKVYEEFCKDKSHDHDDIKFLNIGVKEENMSLFSRFSVEGVPTTIMVRVKSLEVKIIEIVIGADKDGILRKLDSCLKK
jgi:hypothetical protein